MDCKRVMPNLTGLQRQTVNKMNSVIMRERPSYWAIPTAIHCYLVIYSVKPSYWEKLRVTLTPMVKSRAKHCLMD